MMWNRPVPTFVAALVAIALIVGVSNTAAHHFDSIYKTANASWNCFDGTLSHGNYCQTDDRTFSVHAESSISITGKNTILSVLSSEFNTTVLSVVWVLVPVYTGSNETDVIAQQSSALPPTVAGIAYCDDAVSSTRCDQHYVLFAVSSPSSRLVCHELGHAVGLTHGAQAAPAQPDNTADLGCMGTHVSGTGLGGHNQTQINSTY